LGIYKPLAENLALTKQITKPTKLQKSFIPPILLNKDVLIRDTTGSGKTFGVLLSVLNKPRRKMVVGNGVGVGGGNGITSVVVVPNQELAFQLVEWTRELFPTSSSINTKADQEQIQRLAQNPPHVLVATPHRLWDLLQRGVLDLSQIETLVLDEVDHLIRLPNRFASRKQVLNRDLHPKPAELAVARTGKGADRIQIVAASATMNRPMRYWLETVRGWVQDPTWVDTTKSVVLPEGIEHHCVIVGSDSVRNMRFDTSESEKAGEKFRDDDDRMLEGVAMACQLDEVKSACVFFCTSFSLKDLATRFEFEFGLPVKTIQNAFSLHQLPPSSTSTLATTATTNRRSAGIYIAHEENARGLDLPGLSHVFIVGLPSSPSSYLHMAGRTGRMGERGEVVTILRDDEFLEDRARSLFRMLNVKVEPYRHVE
ncbi:MAG: P-loop containing nucleoside triphosphate hydrolase protein, partial [Linnemannia elongata]